MFQECSLCSVQLAKYKTRLFCLDQTALFIKCNAIAEDGVIVLLKLFGILPVFNLLESRCTVFFQAVQRFGIFGLEDRNSCIAGVAD